MNKKNVSTTKTKLKTSKEVVPAKDDKYISIPIKTCMNTYSVSEILHELLTEKDRVKYFYFRDAMKIDYPVLREPEFEKYKFDLVNLVVTVTTGLPVIDLETLYKRLQKDTIVEQHLRHRLMTLRYLPSKFSGLIIKYHAKSFSKGLKFTFLVFASGYVVVVGLKSNRPEFLEIIFNELVYLLSLVVDSSKLKMSYKLVNMVFKFELEKAVDFFALGENEKKHNLLVDYESELFPGCSVSFNDDQHAVKEVFVLYTSKKCVLTGHKNQPEVFRKNVVDLFKILENYYIE